MITSEQIRTSMPANAFDASGWWRDEKWALKRIHDYLAISLRNSKIGHTANISTLPGGVVRYKDGAPVTNIEGTCGAACIVCLDSCYAANSVRRYSKNIVKAWGKNTILKHENPALYFFLIDKYISKKHPKVFRIHVSGEFESAREIKEWNKIALNHPGTTFYTYSKQYLYVGVAVASKGGLAKNFIINLSEWKNPDEIKGMMEKTGLGAFAYVEPADADKYKGIPFCPAVRKNGSMNHEWTCDKCLLCKMPIRKAVWAH